MAGKYKLVVKDGDYGRNATGEYGVKDLVEVYDDLGEALKEFLDWTSNLEDDEDIKATLTYRQKPAKS